MPINNFLDNKHMNQKGFANLILVIVIIVLLGIVGYFVFVKKSEPVAQQPTPTPAQTTNPTKTPISPTTPKDETVNWKIFNNVRDGYSFKYPTDKLKPELSSAGDSGSGWIWSADIGYPDRLGAFADLFTYSGQVQGAINAYYGSNNRIKITSTQDSSVSGKVAKIVLWKDTNELQSPLGKQYFIQYKDNKVLIIGGSSSDVLFNQVVSTINFN